MSSFGKSLLVVEDDDDWTQIIRLWTKGAGFKDVRFASGGRQALRMVRAKLPDCIILDLQLSDQDGTAVCRRVRDIPDARTTPIIMMTNFAAEKVNCLKAGADYFIVKSPNGEELLATIEAVFRRRDMDADLERKGDLAFRPLQHEVFVDGQLAGKLTPKTYGLFKLLVDRSPAPVARDELFTLVDLKEDPSLSRALDILINRLRKSLPERLRKRIRSVRSFGYAYIPPAPKDA